MEAGPAAFDVRVVAHQLVERMNLGQLFQGTIQLIASSIRRAQKTDVNPDDFMTLGSKEVDQLVLRLSAFLRKMRDPHLLNLAECFLVDEEFMRKLSRAPAGIKNHHAYLGGLLEHTAEVLKLCDALLALYPEIDADLLRTGALLHDIGKVREYRWDNEIEYTDEGQLVGHINIADEMVSSAVTSLGDIPEELVWRVLETSFGRQRI